VADGDYAGPAEASSLSFLSARLPPLIDSIGCCAADGATDAGAFASSSPLDSSKVRSMNGIAAIRAIRPARDAAVLGPGPAPVPAEEDVNKAEQRALVYIPPICPISAAEKDPPSFSITAVNVSQCTYSAWYAQLMKSTMASTMALPSCSRPARRSLRWRR